VKKAESHSSGWAKEVDKMDRENNGLLDRYQDEIVRLKAEVKKVRRKTFLKAAEMAEAEKEPKGSMPNEFAQYDKEEVARATVRATCKSIAARLRREAEK